MFETVSDDGGGGGSAGQTSGSAGGVGGAGLLGGLTAFYQPFISQNWATNASRQSWDWARWMMGHRYQLAVADLKKAGLNPALAYTQGGAPGNAPQAQAATFDVDSSVIGQAVSSAKAASRIRDELSILRNQAKVSEEQVKQAVNETERSRHGVFTEMGRSSAVAEDAMRIRADRDRVSADTAKLGTQAALLRAELPSAEAIAEFDRTWLGQLIRPIKSVMKK